MRAFRSRTFLPGLGIAAAAIAAVAVVLAASGGIVAFDRWPGDPQADASRTLVLSGPTAAPAPRTQRSARRGPTASRRLVAAPAAVVARPGNDAPGSEPSPPLRSPVAPAREGQPAAPAPPPRPAAVAVAPPSPIAQPTRAARPVGALVGDATAETARTLRATTGALAQATQPVSPAVATTVAQTGALLGDTVAGAGQAVGALLGGR